MNEVEWLSKIAGQIAKSVGGDYLAVLAAEQRWKTELLHEIKSASLPIWDRRRGVERPARSTDPECVAGDDYPLRLATVDAWLDANAPAVTVRFARGAPSGPAVPSPTLGETVQVRQDRRLSDLRRRGANIVRHGKGWRMSGVRGALADLVLAEQADRRPRSRSHGEVKRDLQAAAEREEKATSK